MTSLSSLYSFFFFFNDTATTEIYTLSLHDALPILGHVEPGRAPRPRTRDRLAIPTKDAAPVGKARPGDERSGDPNGDRKSTRLNSSHGYISYAVFCLKKKKRNRMSKSNTNMKTVVR